MTQLSFNIYVKPAEGHPQMFCATVLPTVILGEPKPTAAEAIEDVKSKLQSTILDNTRKVIAEKKDEWLQVHSFPMQIDFDSPKVSDVTSVEDIERRLQVLGRLLFTDNLVLTPCEVEYRDKITKTPDGKLLCDAERSKVIALEIIRYSEMLTLHIKK